MKSNQRGFTIIELMITVTVLAILSAIAMPMFRTMIANSRASTAGDEMFVALNLARSEAIKRGGRVSICVGNATDGCSGTDWTQGWIVFVDDATSDTVDPVVGVDAVIKQWDTPAAGTQLNVLRGGAPTSFVRFTGMGMVGRGGMDTADANGDLIVVQAYFQGCQGSAGKNLGIGLSGRISRTGYECPGE